MHMQKTVLTICSIGLIALMLIGGCNRTPEETDSEPQSSEPQSSELQSSVSQSSAPRVSAATVKGFLQEHKFLGKPVLVEFGRVGCEFSDTGFSTMITLHSGELVDGLQYARVDSSEDAEKAAEYFKGKSAGFPVVQDPGGKLADVFGATITPLFFLIDKFGNIRYMGVFPEDNLGDWSKMLLAETSDPGPNKPRLGVKEINGQELLASTKLPELGGSDQALSQYAGQGGMMLVFADTSCPYSRIAIKDLPGVASTLSRAARVSTVVVNITDPEGKVREYYDQQNLGQIPVVYDEGSAVRIGWDIQYVPTIIFFDSEGRIAYNGRAVWDNVGRAGEAALDLRPGTLKFGARGTKFG